MPFIDSHRMRPSKYKIVFHQAGEFGCLYVDFSDVSAMIHVPPNGQQTKHQLIIVHLSNANPTPLALDKDTVLEVRNAYEQYAEERTQSALES